LRRWNNTACTTHTKTMSRWVNNNHNWIIWSLYIKTNIMILKKNIFYILPLGTMRLKFFSEQRWFLLQISVFNLRGYNVEQKEKWNWRKFPPSSADFFFDRILPLEQKRNLKKKGFLLSSTEMFQPFWSHSSRAEIIFAPKISRIVAEGLVI
jgi:hypothetical protein